MTSKFSNPPPPSVKPPVCKKGPDLPPPDNMPAGLLLCEWEIATGPPGPTFDLASRIYLYPTSSVRWASENWPSTADGEVVEFIITVTPPRWSSLLKYFIAGIHQFDLFTVFAPIPDHRPFSTGSFPFQSAQVNGDLAGWIFRV